MNSTGSRQSAFVNSSTVSSGVGSSRKLKFVPTQSSGPRTQRQPTWRSGSRLVTSITTAGSGPPK